MKIMTHHSSCITTGSTVNIAVLRGEIISLDIRIERQLRTLQPGQALSDDLVRKLADYCQGVRYLDRNDCGRVHRWRRRAVCAVPAGARPQDIVGGAA
ncbi:hypothetical protein AB0A63_31730 [Lentzea sp. NPDC042327]|uniref:hypothetical protein n=1 Tax=Lentzea sp. NPDC042327 TaxID=3154801 RepID=UPI0033D18903